MKLQLHIELSLSPAITDHNSSNADLSQDEL